MPSGVATPVRGASALVFTLAFRLAEATSPQLCGGVGVFVYRDLPEPFPDYVGQNMLDVPVAEGDGSAPALELGVPCEYTFYGCDRIKNWGKGPAFANKRMPPALVKAGIRYFDTHQNALPWLFVGHIIAHCEVTEPTEAQLFFVPYPIVSLHRAGQHHNITLAETEAHHKHVKRYLRAQSAWGRCEGCDHIISIEKPAGSVVEAAVSNRKGGYVHEDTFWSRVIRLGHHQGILSSETNARYAEKIKTPYNLPVMSVPFAGGFLPKTDVEMDAWLDQASAPDAPRTPEAIFLGGDRLQRMKMIQICKDASSPCSRGQVGNELYFRTYQRYTFSIQPGGDTPTRRAFFDSILAGTIPIVFDPASRAAGRPGPYIEEAHQHYRLCYAKYFSETGWGAQWLDKVALVAKDEKDAMRLVRETPAARIAELQANMRELAPRLVFWDHTAPTVAAAPPHAYVNMSIVPTALRLMAKDVEIALLNP